MESDKQTASIKLPNPLDNYASDLNRFAAKALAWIFGPWAAVHLTVRWWVAIPSFILIVRSHSVFSVPGDKKQVAVPVSGRTRFVNELAIYGIAIAGPGLVIGPIGLFSGMAVTVVPLIIGW
ncbi:MAG: hypothetical protein ACO3L6_05945 [Dehalococcoidia bacterium]